MFRFRNSTPQPWAVLVETFRPAALAPLTSWAGRFGAKLYWPVCRPCRQGGRVDGQEDVHGLDVNVLGVPVTVVLLDGHLRARRVADDLERAGPDGKLGVQLVRVLGGLLAGQQRRAVREDVRDLVVDALERSAARGCRRCAVADATSCQSAFSAEFVCVLMRLTLKTTAAALTGEPSWNFSPDFSVIVTAFAGAVVLVRLGQRRGDRAARRQGEQRLVDGRQQLRGRGRADDHRVPVRLVLRVRPVDDAVVAGRGERTNRHPSRWPRNRCLTNPSTRPAGQQRTWRRSALQHGAS